MSGVLVRRALAAGRIGRANFGRLAQPLKVNFALTYWCQYRCKTCNIWRKRPVDELTTGELHAFIDRNRHISWLDLTGGEIFLREDIEDVLDRFVASWRELAILHFPTNGFLTESIVKVVERIARRGPDIIVTVSVDGDEPLNDEVRGIKGGFARQMDTFRALRRIGGVRTVLGMTLSRYNLGAFERTFAACRRESPGLEPEDFHLNLAQVSEHYYGNPEQQDMLPPREPAMRELRMYRDMRGRPGSLKAWVQSKYLRELEGFVQSGVTPMRCHALRSSCFIDPWGTVFPCITYPRPIGRLRETGMDLAPIWAASATATVQREIWSGQCPQCWTACEAYQSILGNLLRPFDERMVIGTPHAKVAVP